MPKTSQTQKNTKKTLYNINQLKERVKELNCLYGLTKIVKNNKLTVDESLNQIIQLIPPAWQYPSETEVRILLEDNREYKTPNFKKTEWILTSAINSEEKKIGTLEIVYIEPKPSADKGPFLNEELRLIDAISDLIGKFIEERQIKEELKKQRKQLSDAQKTLIPKAVKKPERNDWEVILDLLVKTDPRTLLRLTRKMVYHLYRIENERITTLLNQICPVDRESSQMQWCGINMPNPRQNIEHLITVQNHVFEIAKESIPPEEISQLFAHWMKQDRARPLLLTSQRIGTPLNEIKQELIRFFDKDDAMENLAEEDNLGIRTALIRRFFTGRLDYVNVAKNYFELHDFYELIKHVVGPAQGNGKLGGKTSGVFLAEKILKQQMEDDELLKDIAFPKSWYLTSDSILSFIHYNDLDEVFHVKYLNPEQIRQEQPFLEQIFKNASFPFELIESLRQVIRDIGNKPIIVRSSSLLEDSFGAAFSGKYKSLFVPNTGSEDERLYALLDAIAEVYASTFSPDPIEYRRERGLLDFSEEMGILIQEVVGTTIGSYYMPLFAGVAFSKSEFSWSPRIQREDGMIRLVPGLGTRAVDRVGNDYPILVSPCKPKLRVNTLIEEQIKYSPHYMDVINLDEDAIETIEANEIINTHMKQIHNLHQIISVNKNGRLSTPTNVLMLKETDDLIITFNALFEQTPFLETMKRIITLLEEKIGTPVDVEFASDGKKLYILQCRPQSQRQGIQRKPIPKNIPDKQKLFSANKYVTTGQIENITHIVYVDPEAYTSLDSREEMQKIAKIVNALNTSLPKRKFILMGPGRWGSRGDIKLGVPVNYVDINNTALLIEIAREKGEYVPELSFGTHFFQDLVEAEIKYLPLYPDEEDIIFNEEIFNKSKNHLTEILNNFKDYEHVVRVIKVADIVPGSTASIILDGDANLAVGFIKPPDHWSWRMQKVQDIAADLDAEVFGVEAFYLIGSTKDGSAGPASDIDIIIHFKGSEEQKDKLLAWFEEWNKKLIEENKERTGLNTDTLLDVHLITDEDIKNKTSWATHLTSQYMSVKNIPIQKNS